MDNKRSNRWVGLFIGLALALAFWLSPLVIPAPRAAAQQEATVEKPLVVIRRFEGHAFQFNPATHEVSQEEVADGNVILSIRPRRDQE